MKIVLTGGGTGGHSYPALSVAEVLRARGCELLYVGSATGPEAELARAAGIPFVGLPSRKLGGGPVGIALALAALARGFVRARAALRRFRPDLVIGTGGYAAAAVVLAQAMRGGRTLIHEQNAVPGRTNLWLARYASMICVTFPESARFFPPEKTKVTGLPIRAGLLDLPAKSEARAALGLDEEKFTVLVLGGSQGARALNAVVEALPALDGAQVLHQTGRANFVESSRPGYRVVPYFEEMSEAYAAADLVVSRCGASTLAEITAVGLPSVLVPYPHAYADHQTKNAEAMGEAAILIPESELSPELLAETIRKLSVSPEELSRMAEAARRLGRPDAAREIAEMVVS
ncbi:MAG: undecaprenyldiphospho-muramoylpentapeptide beta-N-acetylglucosaminyltransferase [Armatimonadota bacterium]